jgi:hypothetical protein
MTYESETASCELGSLLDNSEFNQSTGWRLARGGTIDTENGEVTYSPRLLDAGVRLQQSYEVGPRSQVGPMKLSVTYQMGSSCDAVACRNLAPRVLMDGASTILPMSAESSTVDICVGERGYGETDLTILPGNIPGLGTDSLTPLTILDVHFKSASASECPAPGDVRNSGFEDASASAWTFEENDENTTAEIVEQSGDRTVKLGGTQCSDASAAQQLALPDKPNTALQFDADIQWDAGLRVRFDENDARRSALANVNEFEEGATSHAVCVPRHLEGTSVPVVFTVGQRNFEDCSSDADPIYLDDIDIVQNSACSSSRAIEGGELESAAWRPNWLLRDAPNAPDGASTASYVSTDQDTYLDLKVSSSCGTASARTFAQVPPLSRAYINAIDVRYRTRNGDEAQPFVQYGNEKEASLDPSSSWTRKSVCVTPPANGHVMDIIAGINTFGACGNSFDSPRRLQVDDFQFAYDPECG